MTPNTRRKLQNLADQLQLQVEDYEKPPFEINDNTDDVEEPKPAAIHFQKQVVGGSHSRKSQEDSHLASDVISLKENYKVAAAAINGTQSMRSSNNNYPQQQYSQGPISPKNFNPSAR